MHAEWPGSQARYSEFNPSRTIVRLCSKSSEDRLTANHTNHLISAYVYTANKTRLKLKGRLYRSEDMYSSLWHARKVLPI